MEQLRNATKSILEKIDCGKALYHDVVSASEDRQRMPNGIGTTALDLSEQVYCNTNGRCTSNTETQTQKNTETQTERVYTSNTGWW